MSIIDNFIFRQSLSEIKLRRIQICLGLILSIYHLGSLSYFFSQLEHPISHVFYKNLAHTPLVEIIVFIKGMVILASMAMALKGGLSFTVFSFLSHMILAYFDYALFPHSWNFTSHLIFFGSAVLVFEVLKAKFPNSLQPGCSILIAFCLFVVGLIYFQAFLAKMNRSGLEWFLTGNTIRYYIDSHGTSLGRSLVQLPWFPSLAGVFTLTFELGVIFFIVLKKRYFEIAILGMAFHIGTWLTMDISFWHLWLFYPALFFNIGKVVRNDSH